MPSASLIFIVLPLVSLARGAAILNARQSLTPPEECDVIPTWKVTSFNWFNSSNNLDCVTQANARKSENERFTLLKEQGKGKRKSMNTDHYHHQHLRAFVLIQPPHPES